MNHATASPSQYCNQIAAWHSLTGGGRRGRRFPDKDISEAGLRLRTRCWLTAQQRRGLKIPNHKVKLAVRALQGENDRGRFVLTMVSERMRRRRGSSSAASRRPSDTVVISSAHCGRGCGCLARRDSEAPIGWAFGRGGPYAEEKGDGALEFAGRSCRSIFFLVRIAAGVRWRRLQRQVRRLAAANPSVVG
jgi:hypothetical protein